MAQVSGDAYLDDGMRGYLANTARKEHWRVSELYPGEEGICDLEQDGYWLYYKCKRRYVDTRNDLSGSLDDIRWFQAIVKTSFFNHINTLAAKHKGVSVKSASSLLSDDDEGGDFFENHAPAEPDMGSVLALLAKAPKELQELALLLVGQYDTGKAAYERRKVGRRTIRETTNELYCRLLGINPNERDIINELRTFLS